MPKLPLAFTPKLVTVLKEGYGLGALRADALAGLTVAIVALPLSMAIAIASGASPERGLVTAIIGGLIISALGGSRYQIGGPAAAFIALLGSIAHREGFDGLVIATFLAGFILVLLGLFRLGDAIKFVPHPVIVGFSAGIAVLIAASQLPELLGLTLAGARESEFLAGLRQTIAALGTINWTTVAVAAGSVLLIAALRRWKPAWPAFLIVAAVATAAVSLFHLDVATIASRFGGLPRSLPWPSLPEITMARVTGLLPDALAIALLGAIESLLSATVADSLSGARHRPNMELVAQGIANAAVALFGGITATGTIARTATNVRAGSRGPVSGMLHAGFVLIMLLAAAPLAAAIPLAVLAAILVVVAWNMAERAEFRNLLNASRADAAMLLTVLGLTLFVGLAEGIAAGVVLGALIFMHRMARHTGASTSLEEGPEVAGGGQVVIHRISGAFFFGATGAVSGVLDTLKIQPRLHIFDLSQVIFVDASAAQLLKAFMRRAGRHGARVLIAGASAEVRAELERYETDAEHRPSVEACLRSP